MYSIRQPKECLLQGVLSFVRHWQRGVVSHKSSLVTSTLGDTADGIYLTVIDISNESKSGLDFILGHSCN